jgi:hypothetical protein
MCQNVSRGPFLLAGTLQSAHITPAQQIECKSTRRYEDGWVHIILQSRLKALYVYYTGHREVQCVVERKRGPRLPVSIHGSNCVHNSVALHTSTPKTIRHFISKPLLRSHLIKFLRFPLRHVEVMVVEVVTLIALVRFDILPPALNLSYRQCQQAEMQVKYIIEKHYTVSTNKNCRGAAGGGLPYPWRSASSVHS